MAGRLSINLELYKDELEDSFLISVIFQDLKNEFFKDYNIAINYPTI